MKNNKVDEIQINISVVGLSGSENVKGVQGVGKSCLCNRLAQPNFYKQKHVSIISSIDFYGSMINQSHWLYWNFLSREIRGRKYKFHFIEQTIFSDDINYREFKTTTTSTVTTGTEPQDYVKRACMTELRMNKAPYTANQRMETNNSSVNPDDRFGINLFLLVFDVSEVEKRHLKSQETTFKQLFDGVISTKKPLIVVTTKNDIASPNVVEKFKSLIDKRPYNKYPIVETSSKLDININQIYELAASLCENGVKHTKPNCFNYSDGIVCRDREYENYWKTFMKLIEQILTDQNIFISWGDFSKIDEVKLYIRRFPVEKVMDTFEKCQQDLILKRRAANNQRFKEILYLLIKKFDYLIPLEETSPETVIKNLKAEKAFMSHFVNFNQKIEYFKFDQKGSDSGQIPLFLLDPNYENNLIFVITEYIKQKPLETQLFNFLIEDGKKYFKKPIKEIRDELTKFTKYFIQDKVVKNVNDKFQNYFLKNLHNKFLETILENPNFFWSQNIFKIREIHKSWTINGVNATGGNVSSKGPHEKKTDENSFFTKMIKEINKMIIFEDLPLLQDENNIREEWIREYLGFMLSKNENECIIHNVTNIPCSITLINESILPDKISNVKFKEKSQSFHIFYIAILGNSYFKVNFKNSLLSRITNLPLKICKVHSIKYEVEIIQDLKTLKDVYMKLAERNNECSMMCIVILIDLIDELESEINDVENLFPNADSEFLLAKYLLCNLTDNFNPHQSHLLDLLERKKYTVIPIPSENFNQTMDWIISSTQKSFEQNIIWIVIVCGDTYDHKLVVKFLLDAIKDFCLPFQMNASTKTVFGSSDEIIMHNYRLVFISYHQVIKLMIQSICPPTVDAMIFVCSLDRLASINTCLAIKKYLPSDIASCCRCLLLCIGNETSFISEQISAKTNKYGLEYGIFNYAAADNDDFNEDAKDKLFILFKGILSNTGTLESTNSIPSNSSSSVINTNRIENNLFRGLYKSMCQACYDSYRSDISVYANSSLANFPNGDSGSYDQVLGEANENFFQSRIPEFEFDGAQDVCNIHTEIKCNNHIYVDLQSSPIKSFRTRIRSQSGPDLRNPIDFNHIATNKMESIFYCSMCGRDINKSQLNSSNRQSFRLMRQNGTKETTQKTFTAKLQDLFNRKFGETQLNDNRKSFTRSISKRHK